MLSSLAKKPTPRKIFIFSGHMVDKKHRKTSRFPETKTQKIKEEIVSILKKIGANEQDIAFTQGACGSDILFTEACQQLSIDIQWMQPFDEDKFIKHSIMPCGNSWVARYNTCKNKLLHPIQSLSNKYQENNTIIQYPSIYQRCNQWILDVALTYESEEMYFISVWDGKPGDGLGGTSDMIKLIKNHLKDIYIIKI